MSLASRPSSTLEDEALARFPRVRFEAGPGLFEFRRVLRLGMCEAAIFKSDVVTSLVEKNGLRLHDSAAMIHASCFPR